LIAAYEYLRERRVYDADGPRPFYRAALIYVGGVALTTLIAGMATAPFAIYHFNKLAAFGLAANVIAVPVTALWIMPWAVAAFALMPLGLEYFALAPMGWGLDVVVRVAETVAAWPGAATLIPAMPTWGLVGLAFGGLWLTIWRRRWRLAGAPVMVLGLTAVFFTHPPDVLVDGGGKLMAVRGADGKLMVSDKRSARFQRGVWLRRTGQSDARTWPKFGASRGGRLQCDAMGCVYTKNELSIALARQPGALFEDCQLADVVVSLVPLRRPCSRPVAVIDRYDLWRDGGVAIWIGSGKDNRLRIESVNQRRGKRPWVHRPGKRSAGKRPTKKNGGT